MTKMKARNTAVAATFGAAFALASVAPAFADDVVIVHRNKAFTPAEVEVPAGKDFVIRVRNEDAKVIEFESNEMRVEKIISGGREAVIRVRALKPGTYVFVDEFNEKASGKIVAK